MMNLLISSMLASVPACATRFDFEDADALSDEEVLATESPSAAPFLIQAREVEVRLADLVAHIARTELNLQPEPSRADQEILEGADLDAALRMPRGDVARRKGRLRLVSGRSQVVSPPNVELAHLDLWGERGDG